MALIKERRRRQRITASLPIVITSAQGKICTRTKNISILGTYIEVTKAIPIGTSLDIKVNIPKTGRSASRQINCAGTSFRCQPANLDQENRRYGIGIFFRVFKRGEERHLAKYIEQILLREKKIGKIFIHRRNQKLQKGGKKNEGKS